MDLLHPHSRFERLASILTESNEHYRVIAAEVPAAKCPTHHARRQPLFGLPAPTVLRGQHVPWRGPTSRFSLTPEPPVVPDVPFDEMDDDTLFDTYELGYPELLPVVFVFIRLLRRKLPQPRDAHTEMYPVSTKRKFAGDAVVEKRPKYERKS
ncbi:hypothetical protein C8R44DRAFT_867489 [Mycena epipterygia]|nr:hypothetical protein C8R44DRAFT_867489 [Mycena epipterygia]